MTTKTVTAALLTLALAGCSSSGSSNALVPVTPAPTAPGVGTLAPAPAPAPAPATGGAFRSVGFDTGIDGGPPTQSAPGANATVLNEQGPRATFRATVGTGSVNSTLPLAEAATVAASDPDNPLGVDLSARVYQARSQTAPGNERDEALSVIEARYARLAAYSVLDTSRTSADLRQVFAAGPSSDAVARSVPTNGTATYGGIAVGARLSDGEPIDTLVGTVSLNADFGNGTVNGRIDDENSPFVVELQNGTIIGADYAGTAQVVGSNGPVITTGGANGRGTFEGGFYGPNADETAGVVGVDGFDPQGSGQRRGVTASFIATKR